MHVNSLHVVSFFVELKKFPEKHRKYRQYRKEIFWSGGEMNIAFEG